ncbi:AAA family ATPase [Escherichia coli]|nr:AAA family ATPase [Escherichia coli]
MIKSNIANINIDRLIVKNFFDNIACDLTFKKGLNIITGHNSSGKSTVLDFIAYTLGAEGIHFKPAALECKESYLQISIFNEIVTLCRTVNLKEKNSLSVFFGDINSALEATTAEWIVLPYNNYEEKFSFSKLLFELLNYPIPTTSTSIITMNQLLRIIYADQMYTYPIFKFEKWDSSEKRAAIRDFIFGLHTDELYELQNTLKEYKKNQENKKNEIKSVNSLMLRANENYDIEELEQIIVDKSFEKEQLLLSIKNYDTTYNSSSELTTDQLELQNNIKVELLATNKEYTSLTRKIDELNFDIIDSKNFIKELENRLAEINEAKLTHEEVKNFEFKFCPSCYEPISNNDSLQYNSTDCHLCHKPHSKSKSESESGITPLMKMQTEILFQKNESTKLLKLKIEKLSQLELNFKSSLKRLKELQKQYDELTSTWHTKYEIGLISLHKNVSEIDSEILYKSNLLNIAYQIQALNKELNDIKNSITQTEIQIESLEKSSFHRKRKILAKINERLKSFLKQDLERQEEFVNPDSVDVVFEDNIIFVNKIGYFSQSSLVLLRHLFHIALLSVSNETPEMRFPQLLLLDGINDGGLEADRAYNLQHIILNEAQKLKNQFQIIMATSEISEDYNLHDHIIATFTKEDKSLTLS